MRKHFFVSFSLLIPIFFWGQTNFLNISFEEAVSRSEKSGMLIFLQFEAADCSKCNEVADKSFENKELANLLEQTFICIRIDPAHADRETISSLYNIKGFGSFFIDQHKTLIHSFPRTTTLVAEYKKQIDEALTKAGEDIRVSELQKEYDKGNKSPGLIELLLQKRKSLNLDTDLLLDEYVSILPPDSTRSVQVLAFIAKMAPVLGSKADVVFRKDNSLFNRAWYTLDLPTRVSLNSRIIYKSRQKAIRDRDEKYAYRVANFAKTTYNPGAVGAATKSYEYNMLFYYKETNDTVNYLIRALYYYDSYYMLISADSIKRRDSAYKQQLLAKAETVVSGNNSATASRTIRFAPATQSFARDMNEGAWNVYKMTSDPLYLKKALQWSIKSNSFWESAEILDTWARLLYKSGNQPDAVLKEEEAIAVQKKQGFSTKEYESVLDKMKKGKATLEN